MSSRARSFPLLSPAAPPPPPLLPSRGGPAECGHAWVLRAGFGALQSLSPAALLQSPSPAKGLAAMASGSSRDPDWLLRSRERQLAFRAAAGPPGQERWAKFDEEARGSIDAAASSELEPRNVVQQHETLRTDLLSSLAYFEPQADTLIVEGRPTQVISIVLHTV